MELATETSQDSGKSEKSEKPAKNGNVLSSLRLSNGWGPAYGLTPELTARLKALQDSLIDIFDEAGPAQTHGAMQDRMRQCRDAANYLDNQPDPMSSAGPLDGYTLYYYLLPCQAELGVLVPPHVDLTVKRVSLHVRCGSGAKVNGELARLLEVLSEDPED